ncbi:DUF4244 domain-containing protein [Fodinicola feengrottensis]|uniref:DUF4244 domain-containing protein n=1 Tax=Fodinicola feengrottensis TaxID=435914 RepID=A0ABN2FTK9_9ACTN|nr:DUF4244 domain-containing protein [Fodinicola feengrottensis]
MRKLSFGRRLRSMAGRLRADDGMSTAEYAVGTIAAVAFAGILLKVVTSPGVQSALQAIIGKALHG